MLRIIRHGSAAAFYIGKQTPGTVSLTSLTSVNRASDALRGVFEKNTSDATVHDKLIHDKATTTNLVIFDKDGTLICFDSMWVPWAKDVAARLEKTVNKSIAHQVYMTLGVCHKTLKIQPGLLAEGTKAQMRDALVKMLTKEGIAPSDATAAVVTCLAECSTDSDKLVELHDLRRMFRALRQHGLKTAVCTSDTRVGTLNALRKLNISHLVDKIVCGDDPTGLAKPNPHNALMICDALNVHPKNAVMVGDTATDMEFGKTAGLGGSIGVLSGVGRREDLEPAATMIVHSVRDVISKVLPNRSIRLSSRARAIRGTKWKLVIMDKDGTLADINARWREWTLRTAAKLEQLISPEIVEKFFALVGLDPTTLRIEGSVLAEGTVDDLRESIEHLLMLEGISPGQTDVIMRQVWDDGSRLADMMLPQVLETVTELKRRGVKLAICTTDLRRPVTDFVSRTGLDQYVDAIVCGDDLGADKAKPLPHCILSVCEQLNVEPSEAVMVGDTRSDMLCGRAAKVGARIGVLSGVSTPEYVMQYADALIPDVSYLLELVCPPLSEEEAYLEVQGEQRPDTSNEVLFPTPAASPDKFSPLPRQPIRSMSMQAARETASSQEFDYVIVGAGSAGCILANRLTEDGGSDALLMEAGPKDSPLNWKIHMPAALMYNLCDDKYNWYYHTLPQKHMDNRVMYWPRGRVWGGSSSLNAMAYVRGHAFDYDR